MWEIYEIDCREESCSNQDRCDNSIDKYGGTFGITNVVNIVMMAVGRLDDSVMCCEEESAADTETLNLRGRYDSCVINK